MFLRKDPASLKIVEPENALKGRDEALPLEGAAAVHDVLETPLKGPFPDGHECVVFGLGCFWGAERLFWRLEGVYTTAVGYAGGTTPNPSYDEVCSGQTGHTEVVLVVYDPKVISLERLLKVFWEAHDPTQGFRQGNDVGTQYRSAIYTTTPAQHETAARSARVYEDVLAQQQRGQYKITTEIRQNEQFYYAEGYHQQYLDKHPNGYCGLAGCNVEFPMEAVAQ
ncbi:peptide-methionine (S)-S-oxide reductase MsrA [Allohahella marinimesophila]|uniref:Peptide methionine sulfoxide reductase MsrA n=1 Tax=Allohahella marinimesophila TaxID=1054972 RepID=A0ABP7NPG7_9GAMM